MESSPRSPVPPPLPETNTPEAPAPQTIPFRIVAPPAPEAVAESVLGYRRSDQILIGVFLLITLCLMGLHWVRLSGWGLQPVEIEHLEQLFVQPRPIVSTPSTPVPASESEPLSPSTAVSPPVVHQAMKPVFPEYQHLINLNTATKVELMQLPGIGETLAGRVIAHREDQGPFESIEDLDQVKGIGKKTMDKLRPLVTLE